QAYQAPDRHGPLVFTACAPDEWHEVGILIVSIFLARRGYAVRYLGPNLPLEGLAAIVARHHPAVVALSAQSRDSAARRSIRTPGSALWWTEPTSAQTRRPPLRLSPSWLTRRYSDSPDVRAQT